MGQIALLLWYLLILAVQLGPAGWFVARWDRSDRSAALAAAQAGQEAPRVGTGTKAGRWAIGLLLLALPLLVTMPMWRATPALTIALGQGASLR